MAPTAEDRRVLYRGLALMGGGLLLVAVGYFVLDALLEGMLRDFLAGTSVIVGLIVFFVALTLLVLPPLLPAKPPP